MRDSQRDESDPAEGVRRRCMKNSPSFLSCIGKRTKKAVTVAAKSRQFTADKTGKGPNLCTNVSPLQRGGAVPAPLSERWAEMAIQLPRGARPSGHPQSSRPIFEHSVSGVVNLSSHVNFIFVKITLKSYCFFV